MTSLERGFAVLAIVLCGCGSSGGSGKKDGGKDAPADMKAQPDATPEAAAETATQPDAAQEAPTDGGADSPSDTSTPEAAAEAGNEAGSDASSDGDAAEVIPPYDAGLGCDPPPANQTPLVPATEGVPAQGLALWVRADRGIYMTPGAGLVCAWADQSGHGRILTNSGGRPQWRPGTVGGKEGVEFDMTAAAMTTGGAVDVPATAGRTFVAVVASVSTTKRFQPVFQGQAGTAGTYLGIDTNTFSTAGSREGVYVTNNAYDSALATSTAPRVHVFTISTMVAGTPVLPSIDYRVNGVAQTVTRTAGGLGNGNIESFAAADFTAVGSANADTIVAEALIYDHPLGATERDALEAALMARYGIGATDGGAGN
jgi:hypothetical protein